MEDKTSVIFGNQIDKKTIRKANKSKKKFIKKFGDDSNVDYKISFKDIDTLKFLGAKNIVFDDSNATWPEKPLIVGNIRMGFGHYRISIAMASCARALGYTPIWLDLASFDQTGSKMIRYQNNLYSLASRISQKSRIFNKVVWEPLNSEGFKKLTYNAVDQKNSELLVPIFRNIPLNTPYIATHVWPSQAAIHAGMTNVVNAIPDNWPMALHLSEGAIHTVQTPFAYLGYKMFSGFAKKPLNGMKESELKMTGCYIDHELLVNLKEDNELRRERLNSNRPVRILMTVGGAGAGFDMFLSMVRHLIPYVNENKVSLFINFGDHEHVYHEMIKDVKNIKTINYFNKYNEFKEFVNELRNNDKSGVYCICNNNIFEAVYSTNLLMPNCDLLVTKPSELAYYPIPKVFMRHIGGHEVYGAINSQEFGDGTFECPTKKEVNLMLDRLISDKEILTHMTRRIDQLHDEGHYNGGYECVKLATGNYND
ncbi:MAG: hypothetical protein K6G28_05315 [Acholeplasmatales bacterium]|nr:hypothetical protein [Acholeplasmatales bacterium]